jgi:hypothetical protein
MPYAEPHIHLTWGGTLFGVETWSNGLRISHPQPDSPELMLGWAQNYIDEATEAITTWWKTGNLVSNSRAFLTWVKMQPVGTDGRYLAGQDTNERLLTTPGEPGSGSVQPAQLAIVHTLLTSRPRGLGSHGRIYVPCGYDVQNDGLMFPTDCGNMAQVTANLIQALASMDNPGLGTNVQVMSTRGISATVERVGVGRVIDTQRRRRRNLPEEYAIRDI